MSISVVIPSMGRPMALRKTLSDLSSQDFAPLQVIVVAQDELVEEEARAYATDSALNLTVDRICAANASGARNRGLQLSRGDVVLFLDDDVRVEDPGFLDAHLANYRDPDIPGVAGQILAPGGAARGDRHPRSQHPRVGWLYFPRNYNSRCRVWEAPTSNLSVWRSWALSVGGMDEHFERGAHREDSDFTLRLTEAYGELVFDPAASLVHLGEPEGGCRGWGANRSVHPHHHVTGEWYFLVKNLRAGRILIRDLPDHLLVLIRRQILNWENIVRPWRIPLAVVRSARGLVVALRRVREGPRHMVETQPTVDSGQGTRR